MHPRYIWVQYVYGTFMINYARLMRAVAAGMGVAPTARLYIRIYSGDTDACA